MEKDEGMVKETTLILFHFLLENVRYLSQNRLSWLPFFASNLDFGRKQAHFSAFCIMLNTNMLQNRDIPRYLKMRQFNIFSMVIMPNKCRLFGGQMRYLSPKTTTKKMLKAYFRPKRPIS